MAIFSRLVLGISTAVFVTVSSALGQGTTLPRISPPTPISTPAAGAAPAPAASATPAPPTFAAPSGAATAPSLGTAPPPAGWSPNAATPPAGFPAASSTPPSALPGTTFGAPPGPAPGPVATFNGGIQPSPSWDPYATPGAGSAPLFPNDPYMAGGPEAVFGSTAAALTKFRQNVAIHHTWLSRNGVKGLGLNSTELSGTFAVPFCYNQQTPLLITPGFAVNLWNGPDSSIITPGGGSADLPPQTYDAYLEAAWNPRVTSYFGGELALRVGVDSDFRKVVSQSIHVTGRALATLNFSESFQIKGGIFYLDRNRVSLLPAGGVVWTPNSDMRLDILFPNPKITRRLTTVGATDWWWYLRGEYGGGNWTVKRIAGEIERVDYNDLRAAVGLDFHRTGGLDGFLEAGISFDREIRYKNSPEDLFRPNNTVFLGAGVAF